MKLSIHFAAVAVALTASLTAQVSGVVTDSSTGNPIAGAIVTEARTFNRTTTDASGNWSLPTVTGSVEVVGAKKGYFYEGANVTAPQSGIHLALDPVIVGRTPTTRSRPTTARPVTRPSTPSGRTRRWA